MLINNITVFVFNNKIKDFRLEKVQFTDGFKRNITEIALMHPKIEFRLANNVPSTETIPDSEAYSRLQ